MKRGNFRLINRVLAVVLATGFCAEAFGEDGNFGHVSREPAPDWTVERGDFEPKESAPYASGGVFYHLVSHHFRPEEDAVFTRIAYEFQSQSGLVENSTLVWNFDPSFENLQLHWIRVYRDGEWIDLLPDVSMEVVDARTDVSSWYYDDSQDVRIILEDVRVGDVLDYGFTRLGSNPIGGDYFYDSTSLGYSIPVRRIDVRMDWPIGQDSFRWKTFPDQIAPEISREGNNRVYRWERSDVPPTTIETSVPYEFESMPWVQFSSWPDWASVAQWAYPLYAFDAELPPLLEKQRQVIVDGSEDPWVRATEALQFIQDTVRYVSIPVGPHSYQPYLPETIAERRYGDCKDKSLLLVLLLRSMGIEASSVLVDTTGGHLLDKRLPSPAAFDHVVTMAEIEGTRVWMDPTDSHQGGVLPNRYFANYGFGLIVSEEANSLVPDVGPQAGEIAKWSIQEKFTIESFTEPVDLTVRSTYWGQDADYVRMDLASDGLDSFSRIYANYYAELYDTIPEVEPLEVEDDRGENRLSILEKYRLGTIFPDDGEGVGTTGFSAEIIRDQIPRTMERMREAPYSLPQPQSVRQTILIQLPDDSTFEEEHFEVKTKWFEYVGSVMQKNRDLVLNHEFEIIADRVEADQIAEYNAAAAEVEGYLDYYIEANLTDEENPDFVGALTDASQESMNDSNASETNGVQSEKLSGQRFSNGGLALVILISFAAGALIVGIFGKK